MFMLRSLAQSRLKTLGGHGRMGPAGLTGPPLEINGKRNGEGCPSSSDQGSDVKFPTLLQ